LLKQPAIARTRTFAFPRHDLPEFRKMHHPR
jgi:hypothetical protein